MFGNKNSTGSKALLGGVAMTIIQGLITKRVAGRAAGVAARGGAGIPGLLIWLAASYFLNRYLNRDKSAQPAGHASSGRREMAAR